VGTSLLALLVPGGSQPETSVGADVVGAYCSLVECAQYGFTEYEMWQLMAECGAKVRTLLSGSVIPFAGTDTCNEDGYMMPCFLWVLLQTLFGARFCQSGDVQLNHVTASADLIKEVTFDGKTILSWVHPLISNVIRFRYLRGSSQIKVKGPCCVL